MAEAEGTSRGLSQSSALGDLPPGQQRAGAARLVGAAPAVAGSIRRRPRPPKLYRIGEVVEYSGMSRQTIHNYTTMGLLPENCWTTGGHRLYDESAFERLDTIAELRAANNSLQDIRRFLAHPDATQSQTSRPSQAGRTPRAAPA